MKLLQNRFAACALAVLCTLLWGTAFPFIKLGYEAFAVKGDTGSMLLFAGLRFSLAGLMVLLFLCCRERRFALLGKDNVKPALLLGSVQTLGQYLFTYAGIGCSAQKRSSAACSASAGCW